MVAYPYRVEPQGFGRVADGIDQEGVLVGFDEAPDRKPQVPDGDPDVHGRGRTGSRTRRLPSTTGPSGDVTSSVAIRSTPWLVAQRGAPGTDRGGGYKGEAWGPQAECGGPYRRRDT
jgi:hypothetical protein